MANIKEIVQVALATHERAEEMANVIKRAKADRRFKITLADSRAFRELLDDAELLINRAWRDALEIPLWEEK